MFMYDWVPFLLPWHYHNIVNLLYANKNKKFKVWKKYKTKKQYVWGEMMIEMKTNYI